MKIKTLIVLALLLSLFGCATQQNIDPLEGMNRSFYGFNEVVDNFHGNVAIKSLQPQTVTSVEIMLNRTMQS